MGASSYALTRRRRTQPCDFGAARLKMPEVLDRIISSFRMAWGALLPESPFLRLSQCTCAVCVFACVCVFLWSSSCLLACSLACLHCVCVRECEHRMEADVQCSTAVFGNRPQEDTYNTPPSACGSCAQDFHCWLSKVGGQTH